MPAQSRAGFAIAALAGLALGAAGCGNASRPPVSAAPARRVHAVTRALKAEWSVKLGNGNFSDLFDAVAASGEVYVGDAASNEIVVVDAVGHIVRRFGRHSGINFTLPDESPTNALAVGSLALDAHGRTYVADPAHSRIVVFDRAGSVIRRWGGNGFGRDQFEGRLVGVTLDHHGNVVAVDDHAGSYTLKRFTPTGRFLGSWAPKQGKTEQPTEGASPAAVNAAGDLYLPDDHLRTVFRYGADDRLKQVLDPAVTGTPEDVAIDAHGNVLVTTGTRAISPS